MSAIGDKIVNIGRKFEASVFAQKVEEFITNKMIVGIYLNDNRLGSTDDIAFELKGNKLYCIQAKGADPGRLNVVRLQDFFYEEKKGKIDEYKDSLFKKLYKSYKKIINEFPNHNIKIIYASSKYPNQNKQSREIPRFKNENDTVSISFLQFITEYWRPFKDGECEKDTFLEPGILNEWFKKFRNHLNISDEDLLDFFDHFEFEFEIKFYEKRSQFEKHRLEKYYEWFKRAKEEKEGFIPLETFLREIGLEHPILQHDFPVDESSYIMNIELGSTIKSEIEQLDSGYIFISGGPGLGKSSFTQMELIEDNFKNFILFKYLCFRDDRTYTHLTRGETKVFFDDLRRQFSNCLNKFYTEEDFFIRYLTDLSEYSQTKNKKVLIIIDGVDHISRRQNVRESLLTKLPEPQQIPDQIVFMVIGQFFDDIPWFNRNPQIVLEIKPFDLQKVRNFLKNKYRQDINQSITEALIEKTQGNPLFLNFICEQLPNLEDLQIQIECGLTNFPNFHKSFYEVYKDYWELFSLAEPNYLEIAGLLSHINSPIDINYLIHIEYSDINLLNNFLSKFHFFFIHSENLYLFKYNSFKDFLFQKACYINDIFYNQRSDSYYKDLIRKIENYGLDGLFDWNYLYYLNKIGMTEKYSMIDRLYFLNQFNNLRPIHDILEDINLIIEFYMNLNDYFKVFEFVIIKLEFENRLISITESYNFLDKLLECFYPENFKNNKIVYSILNSKNLDVNYKVNIIYEFARRNYRLEALSVIFKDFIQNNTHFFSKRSIYGDLRENFSKVIEILFIFKHDVPSIFNIYRLDVKNFLERHYKKEYFVIREYIYSIFLFGLKLIEMRDFNNLNLVYNHLEEIIINGKWKIYAFRKQEIRNQSKSLIWSGHGDIYSFNPFDAILILKIQNSKLNGGHIFHHFMNDYPYYRALITGPPEVEKSILKEPIIDVIQHENAIKKIIERISFYQQISRERENLNINEELLKELVDFSNSKEKEFQWELLFKDIALAKLQTEEVEDLKLIINRILTLLNYKTGTYAYPLPPRWVYYFNEIITVIILELKDLSELQNWFLDNLLERFKINSEAYSSLFNQIHLLNKIVEIFDPTIIQKNKIKEYIELRKENLSNYYNLWTDLEYFETLLNLLLLLNEELDFQVYIVMLKSFFEKLTFRIGPRKDYQILPFTYFFIELFSYFQPDEIKPQINWLISVIHFLENYTEKNGLNEVKYRFKKYFKAKMPDFANRLYLPDFNSQTSQQRPKIDESNFITLKQYAESPEELNKKVNELYSEISKEHHWYKIEDIFYYLYKNGVSYEQFLILFNYYASNGPQPYLSFGSSGTRGFLRFFGKITIKNNTLGNEKEEILKKIELAQLYPPGHPYALEIDLRPLYKVNKDIAFEWGWKHLKVKLKKNIVYHEFAVASNWLIYTFLPKITETNYRSFWNFSFSYLKDLFDFL